MIQVITKQTTDRTAHPDKKNDRNCAPEEFGNAIDATNCKKAPGEEGITTDIFQCVYKQLPKLIKHHIKGV